MNETIDEIKRQIVKNILQVVNHNERYCEIEFLYEPSPKLIWDIRDYLDKLEISTLGALVGIKGIQINWDEDLDVLSLKNKLKLDLWDYLTIILNKIIERI